MKIYRTRTQSDYDSLMSDLESKGYEWISRKKPTSKNYWNVYKENTCIKISGKEIAFGPIEWREKEYPDTKIIEYKADKEGEK